ncbi:LOW QUALITY PROTEIN: hypothetical protein PanWU01x14_066770 [Parasponia andersonii]|uniref:Uncharacterized protein n=1 Tax=Parasponia andersonii TaxID=3476 RepID=A0A2P5DG86_PARAD|nr:LOW QUALITY PROTEIN: hypothetical protein PanWU01x14_066770 [Parasponia andersonii]
MDKLTREREVVAHKTCSVLCSVVKSWCAELLFLTTSNNKAQRSKSHRWMFTCHLRRQKHENPHVFPREREREREIYDTKLQNKKPKAQRDTLKAFFFFFFSFGEMSRIPRTEMETKKKRTENKPPSEGKASLIEIL